MVWGTFRSSQGWKYDIHLDIVFDIFFLKKNFKVVKILLYGVGWWCSGSYWIEASQQRVEDSFMQKGVLNGSLYKKRERSKIWWAKILHSGRYTSRS